MTDEPWRVRPARGPIPVEVDPDLWEILPLFLDRRREDLELLEAAVASSDAEAVSRVCHRMKGLGGYGFDYLTRVAATLDLLAADGRLDEARPWLSGMADYLDRVEPERGRPRE